MISDHRFMMCVKDLEAWMRGACDQLVIDPVTDQPKRCGALEAEHSKRSASALLEEAWGIIANVGEGDWTSQTQEWQQAVHAWAVDAGFRRDFDSTASAWHDGYRAGLIHGRKQGSQ